jgi:hypothetical protein
LIVLLFDSLLGAFCLYYDEVQPLLLMFHTTCYNDVVAQKSDLAAYKARWTEVEAFQREERRSASLALRWQQFNAAYAIGKSLGWIKPDPTEIGVHERWAMLREKATSQNPQA